MKLKKLLSLLLALSVSAFAFIGCSSSSGSGASGAGSTPTGALPNSEEAQSGASGDLKKVTFVSPTALESFDYVALYVADKMGYFKDEGLDVTIQQAIGTTDSKMVATQQAQFAYPSPGILLSALSQGLPVVAVANKNKIDEFGIAFKKGGNIKTWSDLKGKTIVLGNASWQSIGVPILQAAKVDTNTIKWTVAGDTRFQMVEDGKADGVLTWIAEYKQMVGQGFNLDFLCGDDVLKECANAIIVNTDYAKQNPDTVKAFVRAWAKGSYFMKVNPDAAADIVLNKCPSIQITWNGAVGAVDGAIQQTFGIEDSDVQDTLKNGIGIQSASRWQAAVDAAFSAKVISKKIDIKDIYTNQYIDNTWDKSKVETDAKNYQCTSKVYQNKGSESAASK